MANVFIISSRLDIFFLIFSNLFHLLCNSTIFLGGVAEINAINTK